MDKDVYDLISFLKLYGGKMSVGYGGKRRMHETDDYYPGTGLRAPGAPLHGKPKSHRVSILRRAIHQGLVEVSDLSKLDYPDTLVILTERGKGVKVRCKRCGKEMTPYMYVADVRTARFSTVSRGRTWLCDKCDKDLIERARYTGPGVTSFSYRYVKLEGL